MLLGASYYGEWADLSTFELTVTQPLYNMSEGDTPTVGVTTANLTCLPALYDRSGRMPASCNELVTLHGEPAELMGPGTDAEPTTLLPHVASFVLVDGGDGGVRPDGSFGANATLLLTFNASAHAGRDVRHGTPMRDRYPGALVLTLGLTFAYLRPNPGTSTRTSRTPSREGRVRDGLYRRRTACSSRSRR